MLRSFKFALRDKGCVLENAVRVVLPLWRLRSTDGGCSSGGYRFLVIPPVPDAVNGSMGDVGMLSGLLQSLRVKYPSAQFGILGDSDRKLYLPTIGNVDIASAWMGPGSLTAFDKLVRSYNAMYVIGADMMDGNYGQRGVCRIAAYCNHAVALGVSTTIVGFSFNTHPRQAAIHALRNLDTRVRINLRGRLSLERFKESVGRSAELVADVAFLMQPSKDPEPEVDQWIASQKGKGRSVIGINVNAHVFGDMVKCQGLESTIGTLAVHLADVGERKRFSYLLIPHDFRAESGDAQMLRVLQKSLSDLGFGCHQYIAINDAAKIKRIVGMLDFVVTARMHLAIASLGMGTPALSIAYQDKFEDLYTHFCLPSDNIISPTDCISTAFP